MQGFLTVSPCQVFQRSPSASGHFLAFFEESRLWVALESLGVGDWRSKLDRGYLFVLVSEDVRTPEMVEVALACKHRETKQSNIRQWFLVNIERRF